MCQLTTFTNLTIEETDTKTCFWLVKIKWDNAKYSLSLLKQYLTRKSPFLCFSFPNNSNTFFTFFQPKNVHLYSFKPFHAYYTKWYHCVKFQHHLLKILLVKVENALCWWKTRPLSLKEFENYDKLYQGTAWINYKTNVSTKRWNSHVELHGKNDQPRKKLDKFTIYFF